MFLIILKNATINPYEVKNELSLKFFCDNIKMKNVPAKKIISPKAIITVASNSLSILGLSNLSYINKIEVAKIKIHSTPVGIESNSLKEFDINSITSKTMKIMLNTQIILLNLMFWIEKYNKNSREKNSIKLNNLYE